jgi:mono/diheme cytochrome c family protein
MKRAHILASPCWAAFAVVFFAAACSEPVSVTEDETPVAELMGQGEAMVENLCADCHAITGEDTSAHPDAPALRDLSNRVRLEDLRVPLTQGIIVEHPDMPEWAFEPHHVEALLYYLEHLQSDDD